MWTILNIIHLQIYALPIDHFGFITWMVKCLLFQLKATLPEKITAHTLLVFKLTVTMMCNLQRIQMNIGDLKYDNRFGLWAS